MLKIDRKIFQFKRPIKRITLIFIVIITFFVLSQIIYFKLYLNSTIETKAINSLNLIETRLFDYVKFLENYYKIPFLPEFAELPESKGWFYDLIDLLQETMRREKLISLAIYYQREPFLTWNLDEPQNPPKICKNEIKISSDQLSAQKLSKIEGREYCIYLELDISEYHNTYIKYLFFQLFFYLVAIVFILYLYHYTYKSEERQKEIERRLQAERELALLGRTAGTIAHELRNSLNNLFLLMQTQEGYQGSAKAYQEKFKEELRRILDWTQDVLLFHKSIELRPVYFMVDQLLYEIQLLSATLQTKKPFSLEIDLRVEELWGDPFWLKKALENLLKNAYQAIPSGGLIKLAILKERDLYIIEVFDNGPPIPREIEKEIFEPFFTTRKEGFGLGLYLVRKIMEAHHGEITVENRGEDGKIFRLSWKEL